MRTTTYQLTGAPHPLRAAVVADFHNGDPAPVVEALRHMAPDVILVVGDVVHSREKFERGLELLRALITVAPVFCSLGNHEYRLEEIGKRIRRTGARLLDDSYTTLGGFVIGGLSSGYQGKKQGRWKKTPIPDLSWLDDFCAEKGTHILLSHHPEYYLPYLADRGIELVLAGHAHGGQWCAFGKGLFAPGQGLFPRFIGGAYRGRKRARGTLFLSGASPLLIVSRGLANEVRIPRIGNPTELVCLDFLKKEDDRHA